MERSRSAQEKLVSNFIISNDRDVPNRHAWPPRVDLPSSHGHFNIVTIYMYLCIRPVIETALLLCLSIAT